MGFDLVLMIEDLLYRLGSYSSRRNSVLLLYGVERIVLIYTTSDVHGCFP